jgi:hypothetical protein
MISCPVDEPPAGATTAAAGAAVRLALAARGAATDADAIEAVRSALEEMLT